MIIHSLSNMNIFLSFKGTKEECEKAQERLEKSGSPNEKQWSSAETELSDNDGSDIDSSDDVKSLHNSSQNNALFDCFRKRK